MTPGRELDALVAEKVMGLTHEAPVCNGYSCLEEMHDSGCSVGMANFHYPAHYSTDISAAWQVVEKMRGASKIGKIPCDLVVWVGSANAKWFCEIFDLSPTGYVGYDGPLIEAKCEGITAPHAICLAALKAVGVHIDEELVGQVKWKI